MGSTIHSREDGTLLKAPDNDVVTSEVPRQHVSRNITPACQQDLVYSMTLLWEVRTGHMGNSLKLFVIFAQMQFDSFVPFIMFVD